jgi:hypothetical protein
VSVAAVRGIDITAIEASAQGGRLPDPCHVRVMTESEDGSEDFWFYASSLNGPSVFCEFHGLSALPLFDFVIFPKFNDATVRSHVDEVADQVAGSGAHMATYWRGETLPDSLELQVPSDAAAVLAISDFDLKTEQDGPAKVCFRAAAAVGPTVLREWRYGLTVFTANRLRDAVNEAHEWLSGRRMLLSHNALDDDVAKAILSHIGPGLWTAPPGVLKTFLDLYYFMCDPAAPTPTTRPAR